MITVRLQKLLIYLIFLYSYRTHTSSSCCFFYHISKIDRIMIFGIYVYSTFIPPIPMAHSSPTTRSAVGTRIFQRHSNIQRQRHAHDADASLHCKGAVNGCGSWQRFLLGDIRGYSKRVETTNQSLRISYHYYIITITY